MECADLPKNDPRFVAFLDNWEGVANDWGSALKLGTAFLVHSLREFGCSYLSDPTAVIGASLNGNIIPPHFYGFNFCVEQGTVWPLKPLSYFCPGTLWNSNHMCCTLQQLPTAARCQPLL